MSSTFPPGQSASDFDPSVSGITGENAGEFRGRFAAGEAGRGAIPLRDNLTNLKDELESLLSRAETLSESELKEAYVKLMSKFGSVRFAAKNVANQASRQLKTVADQASRQFNQGVDVTTTYVKDRPLQSVAIATGVGLALGILFGRR